MSKINWTPIIIGAGILTIGGIVWAFYLKKKRESEPEPEPEPGSLAAYYVSEEDSSSAQLVKNSRPEAVLIRGKNLGEGGTLAQSLADIGAYDLTLSIGGQATNPLYAHALAQGLVKELSTEGDRETKRITLSGKDIIFAAGFTSSDTLVAVNAAIAMILSTTQSGIIKTSAYKTINNKVPCPSC